MEELQEAELTFLFYSRKSEMFQEEDTGFSAFRSTLASTRVVKETQPKVRFDSNPSPSSEEMLHEENPVSESKKKMQLR